VTDRYEDQASPCPCPQPVIDALGLAVKYAEASFSDRPDVTLGAQYVKTFMEQPAECWCGFLRLPVDEPPTEPA
jgi:hypothetical protein